MSHRENLEYIKAEFRLGNSEFALRALATLPIWVERLVSDAYEEGGDTLAIEQIRTIEAKV